MFFSQNFMIKLHDVMMSLFEEKHKVVL